MSEFNKGYYRRQGRIQGAVEEQQRIIKLLEEHTPIEDPYNIETSCHGCDWVYAWGGEENDSHEDHIIRLIKGETK